MTIITKKSIKKTWIQPKKICFIIACIWVVVVLIFVFHLGTFVSVLLASLENNHNTNHNNDHVTEGQHNLRGVDINPLIGPNSSDPQPLVKALTDEGRKKPQQPLCTECLQIVQKAQTIDIRYVDVHTNHEMEHPHMGAADPSGIIGHYVADETSLRNDPPDFQYPDIRTGCSNHDTNYQMLHNKIKIQYNYDHVHNNPEANYPRLFCVVYTTQSSHHKIAAIRETWGPKCDGFMVASNYTDPSIGSVNIVHEGEEAYNNIYQKVRSIWCYIYDNYYTKYDWFHIGGDDLFLIVENLRYYLESEEVRTAANGGIYLPDDDNHPPTVQTPLFLGRRFAYLGDMDNIFNSGGSGYTINKAALKTLVVRGFQEYFPHAHTFSEDTMVARIFKKYGVYPYETKDEYGSERYMPFNPGHHLTYRLPKDKQDDWYAKYSIDIKEGYDHCSTYSVAFHYIRDDVMRRFYALLYNLCPEDTIEKT